MADAAVITIPQLANFGQLLLRSDAGAMETQPTPEQVEEIWLELKSSLQKWQKEVGVSDRWIQEFLEQAAPWYSS